MISVLKHPIYARLFAAQAIALLGTGLLTIALGLLAFELAGARAGAVLGTAYAIKMIAYVALSPVASALVGRMPRKAVLIGADLVRAATALFLPFISEIWQIYVLIFVLQAASATFTPAFQATIPDVLKGEEDYTKALSLSRMVLDMENLISPALAGFLLTFMSFHWLFGGTAIGFICSALLVAVVVIPAHNERATVAPFRQRLTQGTRIYLATPRLRGLLALTLCAAAASAFVIVNTVVLVRAGYGMGNSAVALALAAFGTGSMLAAFALPGLLRLWAERSLMLGGAFALAALTLGHGIYMQAIGLVIWPVFLALWALSGGLYSAILTPGGRLLRRSSNDADRPALFAAQFSLSHATWLLTYPVAGFVGQAFGLPVAMLVLGGIAFAGAGAALFFWPAGQARDLEHDHFDLPSGHPHFREHGSAGKRHAHVFVIDAEHHNWPSRG
ncbi:MAG: MFS transporter [Paracoccaceae bacterium]